jgi:hypothetical protein
MASGPGSGCSLHSDDGSCRSGTVLRRVHTAAQNDASKGLLEAETAAMMAAGSCETVSSSSVRQVSVACAVVEALDKEGVLIELWWARLTVHQFCVEIRCVKGHCKRQWHLVCATVPSRTLLCRSPM